MKKCVLFLVGLLVFYSCLNNDREAPNYRFEYLPIESAIIPESFTFGEIDTITLTYFLPNGCYSFDQIYYEVIDTTRIVAVSAVVELDMPCTEALIQEEAKFTIRATQQEDYLFKFFKGKDSIGTDIFEEVVVPVN
tara:strand:- start:308 stop:715 length:408 start_codon:yes stop_codon:yes gene_type:complete